MLGAVVFISGAVLMSLEMVGSRVLAPYFGNSIYVWGSLISVVLAALTAGYFAGGRLADRLPTAEAMGWLITAAGVFTGLLPLWAGSFNDWVLQTGLGVRGGSLLSSVVLFLLPGIFLGAVSPYAVRLAAREVERIGFTAGTLYAISTAGSIVGTLVTAFYLIAWLGVRQILHVLGMVLVVMGVALVLGGRRAIRPAAAPASPPAAGGRAARRGPPAGSAAGGASGARRAALWQWLWAAVALGVAAGAWWKGAGAGWAGLAAGAGRVLLERDSVYHHILVVDDGAGIRHLRFDASWQSGMDLSDPNRLVYPYTRYFHLAMALVPDARRALFVGLGGGSTPKNFLVTYPHLAMDVAELDPAVVEVARQYFALPDDPRLNVTAVDGRIFVATARQRYDVVFLDAYFADSIPFHLTTREFLQEVRRKLNPGGVVASNIIGALSGQRSTLFRSMLKTIQSVFPTTYVLAVGSTTGSSVDPVLRNLIVLATDRPALSPGEFRQLVAGAEEQGLVPPGSAPLAWSLVVQPIDTSDVPLLSDDFAPVDTLIRI